MLFRNISLLCYFDLSEDKLQQHLLLHQYLEVLFVELLGNYLLLFDVHRCARIIWPSQVFLELRQVLPLVLILELLLLLIFCQEQLMK